MIKNRLHSVLLGLVLALAGGIALTPTVAYADLKDDACQGINTLDDGGATCKSGAGGALNKILKTVIQIFSVVVGFVAVLMVVVGGIKYITSAGDAGAVSGAKNTIIYAIVGLIIVAIAQVLVHFVLRKV